MAKAKNTVESLTKRGFQHPQEAVAKLRKIADTLDAACGNRTDLMTRVKVDLAYSYPGEIGDRLEYFDVNVVNADK